MSASSTGLASAAATAVSTLPCFIEISNQTRLANGWFSCAPLGALGVQSCCLSGDYCLPSGLCRYTRSLAGGSGYYAGGCTDPTFRDPRCPQLCNDQRVRDVTYNDRNRLWSCCGANASGGPNCDNPTNENFDAQSPQRMRPIYQANVALGQQQLPSPPPDGGGRPPPPPGSATTSPPAADATSQSTADASSTSSESHTRTWSRGPLTVTVAPPAPDNGGNNSLSAGLAGGIGAACAVIAGLVGALIFLLCRRRRKKRQEKAYAGYRPPSSTVGSTIPEMRSYNSRTPIKPINDVPVEIHQASRMQSMAVPPHAAELTGLQPRELPTYHSQSYEPDALGITTMSRPNTGNANTTYSPDYKQAISPPPPAEHHPAFAGAAFAKPIIHHARSFSSDSPGVSTFDTLGSTSNSPAGAPPHPIQNWKEVTLPLSPSEDSILRQVLPSSQAQELPDVYTPPSLQPQKSTDRFMTPPSIPQRNPLRNSVSTTSRHTISKENLRGGSAFGTPNTTATSGRSRANSFGGFEPPSVALSVAAAGLTSARPRRPSLEQSWSKETHPSPPSNLDSPALSERPTTSPSIHQGLPSIGPTPASHPRPAIIPFYPAGSEPRNHQRHELSPVEESSYMSTGLSPALLSRLNADVEAGGSISSLYSHDEDEEAHSFPPIVETGGAGTLGSAHVVSPLSTRR